MIGGLSFMNQYTLFSFGIGRCNRQTCDTSTLGSGKFAISEIVCFSWGAFSFLSFSFLPFFLFLSFLLNYIYSYIYNV
jgi:hypothetical protein